MTELQTSIQAALAKLGGCPSPGAKFRNGELMNLLRFIVNEKHEAQTQREIIHAAKAKCPAKHITSAACTKALKRLVSERKIAGMRGAKPFLYYSLLQPGAPEVEIKEELVTLTGEPANQPVRIPPSALNTYWLIESLRDELVNIRGDVEVSAGPGVLYIKTESFTITKRLPPVKESENE